MITNLLEENVPIDGTFFLREDQMIYGVEPHSKEYNYIHYINIKAFKKTCRLLQIKYNKELIDNSFIYEVRLRSNYNYFRDTYHNYLVMMDNQRSKEDRNWAYLVKKRDGKCIKCGSVNNLHAHHIINYSDDFNKRLDIDNGVTLCRTCHSVEHKIV